MLDAFTINKIIAFLTQYQEMLDETGHASDQYRIDAIDDLIVRLDKFKDSQTNLK